MFAYFIISFWALIGYQLFLFYRSDFESLSPNTKALQESDMTGKVMGVIITLKGSKANFCTDKKGKVYDFVSRYFVPWVGIPEDPVTGKSRYLMCIGTPLCFGHLKKETTLVTSYLLHRIRTSSKIFLGEDFFPLRVDPH